MPFTPKNKDEDPTNTSPIRQAAIDGIQIENNRPLATALLRLMIKPEVDDKDLIELLMTHFADEVRIEEVGGEKTLKALRELVIDLREIYDDVLDKMAFVGVDRINTFTLVRTAINRIAEGKTANSGSNSGNSNDALLRGYISLDDLDNEFPQGIVDW